MTTEEYSDFASVGKELYHHGILGQKWGIRRFQPYPEGHKNGQEVGGAVRKARHRGRLDKIREKTELVKAKNELANSKQQSQIDAAKAKLTVAEANAARKEVLSGKTIQKPTAIVNPQFQQQTSTNSSNDALKQKVIRSGDPKMIKRYEKMLDNNDYQQAKNRVQMKSELEKQIRDSRIKSAMDVGENLLNGIRKARDIASTSKEAYNNMVEIQNKLFPKSKWKKIKDEPQMTGEQRQKFIQAVRNREAYRTEFGVDPITNKPVKAILDSSGKFVRYARLDEELSGRITLENGVTIDTANSNEFSLGNLSSVPSVAPTTSSTITAPTIPGRPSTSDPHRYRYRIRHSDDYSDELYHHGILGQKWGIRRFQPYRKGEKVSGGKEVGKAAKVKQVNFSEKVRQGIHEVNKLRNTIQKGKEDKAEHKLKMKQLKEAKKDIGRARRHEMMENLRMRVQEKRDQERADRQEEADRRERNAERARQVVGDVAKLGAAAYGIYSLKKSYDSTRDALEEGPLSGARSAFRTASQIRQTASAAGDPTARSPEATTSRSGNTSTERVTNRIPENVSAAIRSNSANESGSSASGRQSTNRIRSAINRRIRANEIRRDLSRRYREAQRATDDAEQRADLQRRYQNIDRQIGEEMSRQMANPYEGVFNRNSGNSRLANLQNQAEELMRGMDDITAYRQTLRNAERESTRGFSRAQRRAASRLTQEELNDALFNRDRQREEIRRRYNRITRRS